MKHLTLSFESKTESLVIPPSPFKDKDKAIHGNFVVADDDSYEGNDTEDLDVNFEQPVNQAEDEEDED